MPVNPVIVPENKMENRWSIIMSALPEAPQPLHYEDEINE